jgi:protein-disulfide isomerase
MKRKGKLALGLLASVLVIPAILGNPEAIKGDTTTSSEDSILPTGDSKAKSTGPEFEGLEVVNVEEREGEREEGGKDATPAVGVTNEDTPGSPFSEGQLKEIKAVVDQTLKNNPEIIVEALQKLNERQQMEHQKKMQESLAKNRDRIIDPASGILLGKPDAETKLVVFLDPNCPHCRTFEEALHKVRGNHPDVAILLKYWPILGDDSKEVVRGLLALKDAGKNEELSQLIALAKGPFTYDMLRAWVAKQKLNPTKFDQDAKSPTINEYLDKTDGLAKELGLQGTPTSLLVGKDEIRLVMPTDEKSLDTILRGGVKVSEAAGPV